MIKCYAAGRLFQVRPIFGERIQQTGDRRFAFTDQDAIHSASSVPKNFFGNKRNAVPTNTDECSRQ
jgi:hypothetical protein